MLLALASAVSLGPSPLGLTTIFYCLRSETPLFVASYDSQGHGGGIRPRLHTVILGTSLYSRGMDHIEKTYYCRDVLPRNCPANSLGAYCYSCVFTPLLPSTWNGADYTENSYSVVRIVV
jgi:hypothetical protein